MGFSFEQINFDWLKTSDVASIKPSDNEAADFLKQIYIVVGIRFLLFFL